MSKIKELWKDFLMYIFIWTGTTLFGCIIAYSPGDPNDEDREVKAIHFGNTEWDILQSAHELVDRDED